MRKLITISLPWEMHEGLVRHISKTDVSVSEYIRELIRKDQGRNRCEPRHAIPAQKPVSKSEPAFVIRRFDELIREASEAKAD